ncbi:MAG: IS21 family transposase, partial [Gammaproteobacteria bacterium]
MHLIAEIRRRHFVSGESISFIARSLNLSRPTVRKHLKTELEPVYQRNNQPTPKLGLFKPQLTQWLEADAKLPKKQRRTGQRLFEGLQEEGYKGAVDSVWRFVRQWKEEQGRNPNGKQAFVPLQFDPGDVCQFDWSTEVVEINKQAQSIKVAHFRMAYSRKPFVVGYPNEKQEMLMDAHNRAFSFFGGVPTQMVYDNPRTIVDKVKVGKERQFNKRFMALANHYLFKPVACTPAAGWEKGQVENQVGNIREWLFTPRAKFDSFESLNQWLATRCEELSQRKHPVEKSQTIAECFAKESDLLRKITTPFVSYIEDLLRVSKTCLIRTDRNRYSVPAKWVGQIVSVRMSADSVTVVAENNVIAVHQRCFLRDQFICNPWHYLSVLEKKPGALRHGAPFKDWELPEAIEKVRTKLRRQEQSERDFIDILLLSREAGLEILNTACALVLETPVVNASAVQNQIQRLIEPPKPPALDATT